MISIIVSSYNEKLYKQFVKNVASTICVPFEIVQIYNPGKMGICEAYNQGAAKAKYDLLCFAHEDIEIKTTEWGTKVVQWLADESVGMIGVAGSKYKTYTPSGWLFPGKSYAPFTCINIIQNYRDKHRETMHVYRNPDSQNFSEVVVTDGVWFCTKKQVVDKLKFDKATCPGFHCYDIDFSLQVHEHYKVFVVYDILIEHFSDGDFSKSWFLDTLTLHKKWSAKLPVTSVRADKKIKQRQEYAALDYFISKMRLLDLPFNLVASYLWINIFRTIRIIGLKNLAKTYIKHWFGHYKKEQPVVAAISD